MDPQYRTHDLVHTMMEKLTAPRVLVVDDEGLIRWALGKALVSLGCDVQEAGDARTAIVAASEADTPFDAVLLDLKLPDSDGLGLRLSVRARVERLGGQVRIRSRSGQGTEVELRIPGERGDHAGKPCPVAGR